MGGGEWKDAIAVVDLCGVVAVRAVVACKIFPNVGGGYSSLLCWAEGRRLWGLE